MDFSHLDVRHAAYRGLQTALVEREDFASGTSSKSTKLVHGGVRYLEKAVFNLDYGQLKLVFEALHERKRLLQNAPHLSSALPIMTVSFIAQLQHGCLSGLSIYLQGAYVRVLLESLDIYMFCVSTDGRIVALMDSPLGLLCCWVCSQSICSDKYFAIERGAGKTEVCGCLCAAMLQVVGGALLLGRAQGV